MSQTPEAAGGLIGRLEGALEVRHEALEAKEDALTAQDEALRLERTAAEAKAERKKRQLKLIKLNGGVLSRIEAEVGSEAEDGFWISRWIARVVV